MNFRGLFAFLLFSAVLAVPFAGSAAPYGAEGRKTFYKQPDDSVIELRVFGDEFYAVTETADGYVLIFDPATKAYYYAVLSTDGDELVSSGAMVRAGDRPKALGLKKNLRISKSARREKAQDKFKDYDKVVKQTEAWQKKKAKTRTHRLNKKQDPKKNAGQSSAADNTGGDAAAGESSPEFAPPETTGGKVGITILVDFPDEPSSISKAEIDDYFNKPGYTGYSNNGSIFDYFYTQSARKLRYNNVITYYVRMQQPKSYYNDTSVDCGICGRLLLTDALDILTAEGFDFSACTTDGSGNIEACNLLFAGPDSGVWPLGLWPHRWVLSSPYPVGGGKQVYDYQMTDIGSSLTIGTVCHENGHMLCKYPDFYDYDGDSNGCGKYTLMASGNHSYQTSPTSVGAYLRYHSGWVDTVDLTSTTHERCSVRVDEGRIYMYDNPDASWPGEYFLIENRAKIGLESSSGLPDQGLLIMHCDEYGDRDSQEMTEADHYECSIEQADNAFDLENDRDRGDSSDLFHSGSTGPNTSFDDSTGPNAHWWENATTNTTSGDHSGLTIHTISASGETMTFISGTGALSGTPEIGLDQSAVYTETDYGQDAPANGFAVWNKQGGTLSYTITDDAVWLSVSPTSGAATTESDVIDISFDSDGLSAGTYNGTITVIDGSATNSPQTVSVQLVVFDPPEIGVNADLFTASAASGASVPTQILKLFNTGQGTMDYSLSKSSPWLLLSSTKGTVVQEEDLILMDFNTASLAVGVYTDTVTVVSASAANSPYTIDVELTITGAPEIGTAPAGITLSAMPDTTDQALLTITNSGVSDLFFDLTDQSVSEEYTWHDSDSPGGPAYSWINISGLGSAVPLGDDAESSMINIGFDFPFYGMDYSQFQIGANGAISFSSGYLHYVNYALPSSSAPAQSICAMWDDLNPATGGSIRYHSTAERLVVSWLGVPFYGTSIYQTFQIVLYPDGRIVYQYNDLNGTLSSCTIGIQNETSGDDFVQVVYNGNYLKNSLAVEFTPPELPWLSWQPDKETIAAGASTAVWFTGSASNLINGVYTTLVTIACNDPVTPEVQIPVTFTVGDDVDMDGLPNWWETQYYSGPTNANTNDLAANGVNTVLDAYVAGFDPTDPDAAFVMSGVSPQISDSILQWQDVSGRVYSVYWSSNLLSGFDLTPFASNITDGVFTDTVHSAEDGGFYRLEVELEP